MAVNLCRHYTCILIRRIDTYGPLCQQFRSAFEFSSVSPSVMLNPQNFDRSVNSTQMKFWDSPPQHLKKWLCALSPPHKFPYELFLYLPNLGKLKCLGVLCRQLRRQRKSCLPFPHVGTRTLAVVWIQTLFWNPERPVLFPAGKPLNKVKTTL